MYCFYLQIWMILSSIFFGFANVVLTFQFKSFKVSLKYVYQKYNSIIFDVIPTHFILNI